MDSTRWTGSWILAAGTALLVVGCGDDPAAPDPVVATVSVSPATVTLTAVGETTQLTANARTGDGAEVSGRSYSWQSSDIAVVTVTGSGLVTAVGNGSATITATTGSVSGSATVEVSIPGGLPQISAGFDHTCALTVDGVAFCWGRNNTGQLGDGSTTTRLNPVAVQGNLRFGLISAGQGHTCAVTFDGEGYCWGNSDRGQVGDGGLMNRVAPARVVGVPTFGTIQAGRAHTCGLTAEGVAYCWGGGGNGESGSGTTVASRVAPDSVNGGRRYTVLAGAAHTICAIATVGETYCWGRNNTGQVGDGTTTCTSLSAACFVDRSTPTRVAGSAVFVSVSSNARIVNGFGGGTSCGVTAAGVAHCWGQNASGQVGDGTVATRLTPTLVSGNHTWRSIAVGSATTCGVTTSAAGYCWGFNGANALGDGTSVNRLIPTAIGGGHQQSSISVGYNHACAVTLSGDFYCWGSNTNGELGDGTTSTRSMPTRVEFPN
ncbi:MAG TPA: Ig-like domain-containing protein [Gemmatimonadaceae bacterium]